MSDVQIVDKDNRSEVKDLCLRMGAHENVGLEGNGKMVRDLGLGRLLFEFNFVATGTSKLQVPKFSKLILPQR